MLQIVNISQARTNLSSLVKKVASSKKPVIILRDSVPSVILYPYEGGAHSSYGQDLLSITGSWFSEEEHRAMRNDLEQYLKQNHG